MFISLLAAAAIAQAPAPAVSRDCLDDNHVDRCAPADRARVVAMFGMTPAEAEAKAGVEAYRAFFVDGYGRERPTIAFERRPGEPPKAVVYAQGRRIETPASAAAWTRVRTAGRFADRALAPVAPPATKPGGPPEFRMCLHAWVTSVEIVSAPERDEGPHTVRTRTEDACDSGLATLFAFDLAALAVEEFAACGALKAEKSRNDVERLAFCTKLHGDTAAAAGLANQIGDQLFLSPNLQPALAWRAWMGMNAAAELDWNGQAVRDDQYKRENLVGQFLAAQNAKTRLEPAPARFEGLDSRRVKVAGHLYRYGSSEPQTRERAPYEQSWVWDTASNQWMLKSWTVGAFAPAPYGQDGVG